MLECKIEADFEIFDILCFCHAEVFVLLGILRKPSVTKRRMKTLEESSFDRIDLEGEGGTVRKCGLKLPAACSVDFSCGI